jgi:hypothetical protein
MTAPQGPGTPRVAPPHPASRPSSTSEAPGLDAVLDEIAAVADAVLFEGYLLYPYRASAQKNRLRWQFGVLTPAADESEPTRNRTECLLEPARDGRTRLHVRLRCLQLQARTPCTPDGAPVPELVVDGQRHLRFEEGVPRHVDAVLDLDTVLREPVTLPILLPGAREAEEIRDAAGTVAGRLLRECWPVSARLVVSASDVAGPYLVHRLRLVVENDGAGTPGAPREEVLRTSLIAAHTLIAARGGTFLSLTDPPQWAELATKECVNEHTWPVLAGPDERTDLVLSSPIILADHPQLAPESTINLFDGLENDEILTLRTLVLTDEEKAEARATDPRAAGIIDAVDSMPPEILERLHGVIRSMRPAPDLDELPVIDTAGPTHDAVFGPDRADGSTLTSRSRPADRSPEQLPWWDPAQDRAVDPDTDSVLVGDVPVAKGSQVVLRPGRAGDAQDRFLDGMRATVQAVVHDVDGRVHVAVSVDADPAGEMQLAHGRFRYFHPDELEALP